jgi:enoyl-CoA hydratase/carnithine racemase
MTDEIDRMIGLVWSMKSPSTFRVSDAIRHFPWARASSVHTPQARHLAMVPRPPSFKTVVVDVDRDAHVGTLRLNRPRKSNAIDPDMWLEIPRALRWLDEDEDVRVVVVCAAGKNFCAGIDVSSPELLGAQLGRTTANDCAGREAEAMYRHVRRLQDSFSAFERCRKPVVCAIQGACFGGGVDLAAACDVRFCASDATFCVKEVDLAIVADIGTLQRLPTLIGHGRALELALTARVIGAAEAKAFGLVTDVVHASTPYGAGASDFSEGESRLLEETRKFAARVAAKSPLATRGTKTVSLHARDHSVAEGLEFVARLNAAQLRSADLKEAMRAKFGRETPTFAKL